jgi:1-acyl-sn-glycerol-3-phosphate acyltransferase
MKSSVSSWLINPIYALGNYLILPFYFGRVQIIGQENIPRTGAVIIAPKHCSRWDGLIIGFLMGKPVSGRDLRFMISANEMEGWQGWFLKRLGGFPVDTQRPGISSVRQSVEILGNQEMMVIFPEGNIYRDHVNSIKEGLARIALQAQSSKPENPVKILPVSIRYSATFPTKGTDIYLNIGKPLNVADYHNLSTKEASKKLTADLQKNIEELYFTPKM